MDAVYILLTLALFASSLAFIRLCTAGRLPDFYHEAGELLTRFLDDRQMSLPEGVLEEAVALNHALVKLPFQEEDLELTLQHNIGEIYRGAAAGRSVPLERRPRIYHIDRTSRRFRSWEEWINVVLGAWLVASPWVLGATLVATTNLVIVGVLVLALAVYEIWDEGRHLPRAA